MAQKYDLIAEMREDQGKGASRRLRREGKVPAIIYGAGRPPRKLAFDHNRVIRLATSQRSLAGTIGRSRTLPSCTAICWRHCCVSFGLPLPNKALQLTGHSAFQSGSGSLGA